MKSINKILCATGIIMLITSCTEVLEKVDDGVQTVYENPSNPFLDNSSLVDDNLVRIERIGSENMLIKSLHEELESSGVTSEILDFKNVRRFRFSYTDCNLYSIGHFGSNEKTIVYEYDGVYLVAQAKLEPLTDSIQLFELHTTDGNLCYSVEVSTSNSIGEINIKNNQRLDNFRSNVGRPYEVSGELKGTDSDYCRQESSWSECFNCSMNFCAEKWYCSIAMAVYPLEFIAGWAASCIGASSGTFATSLSVL